METYIGQFRFIYRDHRTIGGFIARWFGVEDGWKLYAAVFTDFEQGAEGLRGIRTGA